MRRTRLARGLVRLSQIGSPATRERFLRTIPKAGAALEIGPFGRPVLKGPHVRYADALSAEQLRAIAPLHGMDPEQCPDIHYVITETPLDQIEERFAAVFSSHCIEHQPDLVGHLRAVGNLLEPGGAYYLIVPDKRYCFDHFRSTSTIADVISAHCDGLTRHDFRTLLSNSMLLTHNDPVRHWAGDHGAPVIEENPAALDSCISASRSGIGSAVYVDQHAWQFTPDSFRSICSLLHHQGLTSLRPVVVHPTPRNRLEFCAMLTL